MRNCSTEHLTGEAAVPLALLSPAALGPLPLLSSLILASPWWSPLCCLFSRLKNLSLLATRNRKLNHSLPRGYVAFSLIQHAVLSQISFGSPGQLLACSPGGDSLSAPPLVTMTRAYCLQSPVPSAMDLVCFGEGRTFLKAKCAEKCGMVSDNYIPQRAEKICQLQPFPKWHEKERHT